MYAGEGKLGQALELLGEIVEDIKAGEPNMVRCCQGAIEVCHLLGLEDETDDFQAELQGYTGDAPVPTYRAVEVTIDWYVMGADDASLRSVVLASNSHLARGVEMRTLLRGLPELVRLRNVGYTTLSGSTGVAQYAGGSLAADEYIQVSPSNLQRVLENIAGHFFTWASRTRVHVEHDRSVGSVFEKYVSEVEGALQYLGMSGWLKQIRGGLAAETPEGNASAVMACRGLLNALSDSLLQVAAKVHPVLKNREGTGPMSLTLDKTKNRLKAYVREMALGSSREHLERQMERLDSFAAELWDRASKGKRAIEDDEAEGCVAQTYLFIGELNRLTQLVPAYELTSTSVAL